MAHLTPLESAVMDAMVWQMGDSVPDLAAQIASGSVGLRRNTGAGLYVQFSADPNRRADNPDATGLFGTVHVMVGDLPDPVGFQIELRQGRLTALHGQSYSQDTRGLDFSNVRFADVFTVNEFGESVLFRQSRRAGETRASIPARTPTPQTPETAVELLKRYADFHADETRRAAAPQPEKTSRQPVTRQAAFDAASTTASPVGVTSTAPVGKVVLVYVCIYALIGVLALILSSFFRIGPIMGIFFGFWAIRIVHGQKGREFVGKIADLLGQQGVLEQIKPR